MICRRLDRDNRGYVGGMEEVGGLGAGLGFELAVETEW